MNIRYLLRNLDSLAELTWGEVNTDGIDPKLRVLSVWGKCAALTGLMGERLLRKLEKGDSCIEGKSRPSDCKREN